MPSKNPDWIESRADVIENVPFADLRIGQRARLARRVTRETIEHFAESTGDFNPAHLDEEYARASRFGGIIAHGMWSGALISAVLGTLLPGPGTIYLEQTLKYLRPVRPGDLLSAEVTVAALDAERHRVELECEVRNQDGDVVVRGVATVLAPLDHICRPRPALQTI
ncbi:MaoC/PaaZ C-terminal domain-containing protein [Ottowia sp.]|uniref:MaoC/PaaZ C-terminal domain-containing protein n=1 Tax=Ottowia sp. TaxID=1898956 RepID=UPI002B744881|nr:MaoC/PaaZ C-terminal domain-containing protein [Ottowia sp.]HOB66674.1 MaoC/PaaZ C-terminal domain-containing protein [Ottowia sp.]HPZ57573.1 MaoC/PaaZ C-terminal domain-containing protein [Ottowia sp.]HQD47063.1 MaoC/PaaZ C-terminal domain-containing protein [Ottowia sp.]